MSRRRGAKRRGYRKRTLAAVGSMVLLGGPRSDSTLCYRAASNSSTGLPSGSSSKICLPPGPMTTSLRKRKPACFISATRDTRSSTSRILAQKLGQEVIKLLCPLHEHMVAAPFVLREYLQSGPSDV